MTVHSHSNTIEAVHRGFLYQHLFAVGVLLLPQAHTLQEVTVEGDEDVELLSSQVLVATFRLRLGRPSCDLQTLKRH